MYRRIFAIAAIAALVISGSSSPLMAQGKKKEGAAKRPPTAAQTAARERQKKCSVEWKEAKAAGKTAGQKWPQFWSACNKRLKAGA